MKKIIFTFLITLLLTSCSLGKKVDNVAETTSSGITQSKKEIIDKEAINSEKRKQVYLENTSNDVKKVFEDLEKAKKSKDIQKEQELLKEIKKLEDTKRKELEELVKKGDNEKAKKLRREMSIFGEIRR